jgi:hypothetical protein
MSTTRKYGGTGLGLNLVQKLVEAHGGAVRVHSKMGEGTIFCFNLKVDGVCVCVRAFVCVRACVCVYVCMRVRVCVWVCLHALC